MKSRLEILSERMWKAYQRLWKSGKPVKAASVVFRWEEWWERDCERRAQLELELVAEIDTDR